MTLENIKVSAAYESPTNPRGDKFEGKAFNDLVASIKEKGVLVPVIVRPNQNGEKQFEIVAGNRRFRAAQTVGLEEIPARIEEMTDEQAQEVQIIENLQREDVHPIEEGQAYRQLVEKSKLTISELAQRVGKSESYVRYRLFLTNLNSKVAAAFRKGKITDGHAVLIAKLSDNDQTEALEYCNVDGWGGTETVSSLKKWIEKTFYNQLENQPWLNDKEANEAVGPCKECRPNRSSLFGDIKEGACTDLKCWKRKMGKYIDYVMAKKGITAKVSKDYGTPDAKDVLSKNNYEMLSTNKKKQCESAQMAIVAEGKDLGTIVHICKDPKCKTHGRGITPYAKSPEEKERRKKEMAKEQAKKEKADKELLAMLDKIDLPLISNDFQILFELILKKYTSDTLRDVAKRHNWEPIKDECDMGGGKKSLRSNWEKTVRKNFDGMKDNVKFRLIIEIMLEGIWSKDEIIKMIKRGV